jgi:hypothetical protein
MKTLKTILSLTGTLAALATGNTELAGSLGTLEVLKDEQAQRTWSIRHLETGEIVSEGFETERAAEEWADLARGNGELVEVV